MTDKLAEDLAKGIVERLRKFAGLDWDDALIAKIKQETVDYVASMFPDAPRSRVEKAVEAFVTIGDKRLDIEGDKIAASILDPQLTLALDDKDKPA